MLTNDSVENTNGNGNEMYYECTDGRYGDVR